MVPSTPIVAVGGEIATIVHSLESHAEVVGLRVEGIARMFKMIAMILAHTSNEDIVATQARMAVA